MRCPVESNKSIRFNRVTGVRRFDGSLNRTVGYPGQHPGQQKSEIKNKSKHKNKDFDQRRNLYLGKSTKHARHNKRRI